MNHRVTLAILELILLAIMAIYLQVLFTALHLAFSVSSYCISYITCSMYLENYDWRVGLLMGMISLDYLESLPVRLGGVREMERGGRDAD